MHHDPLDLGLKNEETRYIMLIVFWLYLSSGVDSLLTKENFQRWAKFLLRAVWVIRILW